MQFPVSLPDDGLIDIVVQERVSSSHHAVCSYLNVTLQNKRSEMLNAIEHGPTGQTYWLESVSFPHYLLLIEYDTQLLILATLLQSDCIPC